MNDRNEVLMPLNIMYVRVLKIALNTLIMYFVTCRTRFYLAPK